MNDASHPSKPAFPQPVSGTVVPRFGDVATFMRLPLFRDPADVEIGMVGVPWDGGTTNRPGARHGPRQMRDLSTMMRRVHHVTGVAPYELAKCGDLGDAPVNPASLDDSLERIEAYFAKLHSAGAVPLSAGGDHLITLPIMRGIAKASAARHGAFRRPQRHLGHLFRRLQVHPRHAVPPRRRGGPARSQARGPDRHPRLALQARRQRLGGRAGHAGDHHRGVFRPRRRRR
jgi:hypothetical protein